MSDARGNGMSELDVDELSLDAWVASKRRDGSSR
jgi:hypothetical protein